MSFSYLIECLILSTDTYLIMMEMPIHDEFLIKEEQFTFPLLLSTDTCSDAVGPQDTRGHTHVS